MCVNCNGIGGGRGRADPYSGYLGEKQTNHALWKKVVLQEVRRERGNMRVNTQQVCFPKKVVDDL